jgi:hypothetical protein
MLMTGSWGTPPPDRVATTSVQPRSGHIAAQELPCLRLASSVRGRHNGLMGQAQGARPTNTWGRARLDGGRSLLLAAGAVLLTCLGCDADVEVAGQGSPGQGGTSGSGGASTSTTTSGSSTTTSTHSTTSTSTGTTTSSTTEAPCGTGSWCVTCCNDCFASSCTANYCSEAIAACDAEPDCADLDACIAACTDGFCLELCKELYAAGYEPLTALKTCWLCDACTDDCNYQSYDCPIQY